MGWSAAGGSIFHPFPILLACFIFLWQIPHFWLLMLKYGEEYQVAGLPVLSDLFSPARMKNIILAWVFAASASSLLLLLAGGWREPVILSAVIVMNSALVILIVLQFYFSRSVRYRLLFISMNLFMLSVLLLLALERMLKTI
jgi:heme o synthase